MATLISNENHRTKRLLSVAGLIFCLAVLCPVAGAQTYKIGGAQENQGKQSNKKQKQNKKNAKGATPAPAGKNNGAQSAKKSLGWGSNIQNTRLAHAAVQALKNRDYSAAVDYAQHATQSAPNDPKLWFLLGYASRLAGRLQPSVDAYNKGLQIDPSSADGQSGLAQTYSQMGRRNEAIQILTRITSADPKRGSDFVLLGELLLHDQNYQQALTNIQHGEQIHPAAHSEVLIALCYERMNQLDQANQYLQLARKRAPNNPDVRRSLAAYYRVTGDYKAAIDSLVPIAYKDPKIKAELAYTYLLYGKREKATKLYAEAADAAPKDLPLQLSAGQAEVNAGDLDAAQRFVQRAAAIDPEHYHLHALRGQIARLNEDNAGALREYEAALARLPQLPSEGPLYRIQLHLTLMDLHRRVGDDAAAKQELSAAQTEINGVQVNAAQQSDYLRLRATIKMQSGDLAGAEQDAKNALALNAKDTATLQLMGDVLVKSNRSAEALATYKQILSIDPNYRSTLVSLGYLLRQLGQNKDSEKYFQHAAATYPRWYVPQLALGDVYTSLHEYSKAQAAYKKAANLAPNNPSIVAGGMNAAIEAHHFNIAGEWLQTTTAQMREFPQVMKEQERYLRWVGKYQESADVGRKAIEKLPMDRDVVVYLAYDLLYLKKYDELEQLTSKYENLLPKEPDIPLLAGYVHKHANQLERAKDDFTAALQRNPDTVTAYVNRGYVLNDLHKPADASADFIAALQRDPDNGEAHMGLAFSSLDLNRPQVALREVQLAEKQSGDSLSVHLIRATAYGQEGMLLQSEREYRLALQYAPDRAGLHLALANALYGLHEYHESMTELQAAKKLSPDDRMIDAQLARSYAQLGDRDHTIESVRRAEDTGDASVLLYTGQAMAILGDDNAAMVRFSKALVALKDERVTVRLAIARVMENNGKYDDARRQIALAMMEARTGETLPPTGSQLAQVGGQFMDMHDFDLAETFFQRAQALGASDMVVRVGLANVYLEQGDMTRAEGQLSLLGNAADNDPTYPYLLAKARLLLQQRRNAQALTAFAEAANAAGEDETADQNLVRTAGLEGLRLNDKFSFLSNFSVEPIFEDSTIYPLDAALDVKNPLPGQEGLLPPPRSSMQTQWTGVYHLHLRDLPNASGFFQVRNARGQISLPSADEVVNRNTTDYSFNFAVNPTFELLGNTISFSTGLQETVRRDSLDPTDMNQNLFRQFVYMSTSSFFNMISINGYALHEGGPFTERDLHSRDYSGQLNFRVGRPWGKTALVTGWGARDLLFSPLAREFFYTSSYIGLEHKFPDQLQVRVIAEDLRSWRVQDTNFAIAQALRPAARVRYDPTRDWRIEASFAYSSNMGFHSYDNVRSGFTVSYSRSVRHDYADGTGDVPLRYPIRLSFGMQQQDFFNFPGSNSNQFRPYMSLTIF